MSQTLSTEQRSEVREIARAEVASLCGLVLRRLQDVAPGEQAYPHQAVDAVESAFGEALRDFSATEAEPGKAAP